MKIKIKGITCQLDRLSKMARAKKILFRLCIEHPRDESKHMNHYWDILLKVRESERLLEETVKKFDNSNRLRKDNQ